MRIGVPLPNTRPCAWHIGVGVAAGLGLALASACAGSAAPSAAAALDCQASCLLYQRCTSVNGVCVATTESCQEPTQPGDTGSWCGLTGNCQAVDGSCQPTSDADCENSGYCGDAGHCKFANGACVATKDGCSKSTGCATDDACVLLGQRCHIVTTLAVGCAGMQACRTWGDCTVKAFTPDGEASPTSVCGVGNDADCLQSWMCVWFGACHLVDDECVATATADCAGSSECKSMGECTLRNGKCVPGSDGDCAASVVACGQHGLCRLGDGVCRK